MFITLLATYATAPGWPICATKLDMLIMFPFVFRMWGKANCKEKYVKGNLKRQSLKFELNFLIYGGQLEKQMVHLAIILKLSY